MIHVLEHIRTEICSKVYHFSSPKERTVDARYLEIHDTRFFTLRFQKFELKYVICDYPDKEILLALNCKYFLTHKFDLVF